MSNRVIDYGVDGSVFTLLSNGTETFYSPVYPAAAQQALTGAGAVNVTSYCTTIAASGAIAITLAAGTVKGQMKKIRIDVATGAATLTIANPVSASTDVVVYSVVGDTTEMVWTGTAWAVISRYNAATGAITTPTIA